MDRERVEAILTEINYWKLVLDDTEAINDKLQKINDHVADLIPISVRMFGHAGDKIMSVVTEAQEKMLSIQENIDNLARLSEGRLKMLGDEVKEER